MNGRRRRIAIAAAAAATIATALAACAPGQQNGATVPLPAVVPAPSSIEAGTGDPFRLSAAVALTGDADAADAFAAVLNARTGLAPAHGETGAITFRIEAGGPAESYRIAADAASITVTAPDAAGLFYGAQTLGQLVRRDGDGWAIPAVAIADEPRFAYRGVMLDVARHFLPVEVVEACIDRAAGLKLNALHLHLSDDQGWRIQLDSRPELTAKASATSVDGDPGGFYTKADYAEIVAHAASRHMIVVPEIDLPGHTHAVGLAYPELTEPPVLADSVLETVRATGGEPPEAAKPYTGIAVGFSSLKIHDEATYDFVADVFGELAAMTPGPYLHIGGDEALGTPPADFAEFVARASEIVSDLGKTPIAWHEAGAAAELSDDAVGQYW